MKNNTQIEVSNTLNKKLTEVEAINHSDMPYIKSFFSDYYKALMNMFTIVQKYCCIVIGNRTINKNITFPMDSVTEEFGTNIGFTLVKFYYRKIPTKAIAWEAISGSTMDMENIIILKK